MQGNGYLIDIFFRGKWKGTKSCPKGFAICGIRVRIEDRRGNGWNQGYNDDTALNGAEFKCCSLPEIQDTRIQSCFSDKSPTVNINASKLVFEEATRPTLSTEDSSSGTIKN